MEITNVRDFTNVGGNNGIINIIDNPQPVSKRLVDCTNEELHQELPYRMENDRLEQWRKIKRLMPSYFLSLGLLVIAAFFALVSDKPNLMSFAFGLCSIMLGLMSLRLTIEPNAFQLEERAAVAEIKKILLQRRAI
jgi:hypothetical protein